MEARVAGMLLMMVVGCTSWDKGSNTGGTGEPGGGGEDDTGEDVAPWYPDGSGHAWFEDGATDGSLFALEIVRAPLPREDEAYWGWLLGGASAIPIGEIPVTESNVAYETDIGFDALLDGVYRFEAYAGAEQGAEPGGELLWEGEVPTDLRGAYERLLVASDATPDGSGSLRSVETTIEILSAYAQEAIDLGDDVAEIHDRAEALGNAIAGESEDRNDDGAIDEIDGVLGLLGDEGHVALILSDLDAAHVATEQGDPVWDFANYAYDCTQRVEDAAEDALSEADVATNCGGETSCDIALEDAIEALTAALEGADTNEDGTIDVLDEGTIECAIFYVGQMARMDVVSP